jgi:putative MATE family efflux protein
MGPKRDLTKGSLPKHMIALSAPMIAAMFMYNIFTVVDTFFVGKLGPEAIAAVATSFPFFFIIIALASGIGVGVNSLIARNIGAKNFSKVNVIAENGLIIAGAVSLLLFISAFFVIKPLVGLLGVSDLVAELMHSYVVVIYLGGAIFLFAHVLNAMLQAEGDTKASMKGFAAANIANIILDPILIFGLGPFPRLEVTGAAIATVIGQSVALLYFTYRLFGGSAMVKLQFTRIYYSFQTIKQILGMSIPISASRFVTAAGIFVLNGFVASFGSEALAGYGIAFRIESLAILPAVAMGLATIVAIGQNIGAKMFDRAKHATTISSVSTFAFMAVVGLFFIVVSSQLVAFFTNDAVVILHGKAYFGIVALSYGFIGLRFIAESAFQGIGKTFPMFMTTSLNFGLMLIAAYTLAFTFSLGLNGIWLGILGSNVIAGIAAQLWFRKLLKDISLGKVKVSV